MLNAKKIEEFFATRVNDVKCKATDPTADAAGYIMIEFHTSVGQDVVYEGDYNTIDELINNLTDYVVSYDPDEEAAVYVSSRGINGVPSSVREIIDSTEEAKETLLELADMLGRRQVEEMHRDRALELEK